MKTLLALIVLFFAAPLWAAAPTFDATQTASGNGVNTLSVVVTVGGGCTNRTIIGNVAWWQSGIGSVSSFNIGGSAATFIAGVSPGAAGVGRRVEMWHRVGVSTGANTVEANMDGSKGAITVSGRSYCGVHQTTSLGVAQTFDNVGNDNVATVDVSSAPDQLVVDAVQTTSNAATITVGAGQTQRVNDSTHVVTFLYGSSDETGSGTTTMSWTADVVDYIGIIAVPLIPVVTAVSRRRVGPMAFQ